MERIMLKAKDEGFAPAKNSFPHGGILVRINNDFYDYMRVVFYKGGNLVAYASYFNKEEGRKMISRVSSADSLDWFFALYIGKNMSFEEIIKKRIEQIKRK